MSAPIAYSSEKSAWFRISKMPQMHEIPKTADLELIYECMRILLGFPITEYLILLGEQRKSPL
jgi:hypothetical protein